MAHDDDEEEVIIRNPIPLEEGKIYLTPEGYDTLEKELSRLRYRERPEVTKVVAWAAGNGDRSENGDYLYGKKKLREIDKRIEFLNKRLGEAVVLDIRRYLTRLSNEVVFGSYVTIRFEDDREVTYQIVGVDEVSVDQGKISWRSPLGRALLRGREGEWVEYNSPRGVQEVEILSVSYESAHKE
jgi:transcription elongation factor GreB